MTRIHAVDYSTGRALFIVSGRYVIVDINKLDVDNAPDLNTALTAGAWMRVAHDLEYPSVWRELADAAVTSLQVKSESVKETPPAERKFRVPQAVKTEAQQSLDWMKGFERGSSAIGTRIANSLVKEKYVSYSTVERINKYFSRRSKSITENAGWSAGTQGYPTNERIRYGLWGGEAAREWSSNIITKHAMVATSGPTDTVDGSKPHAFTPDPDSAGECLHCGRTADNPIHTVTASAFTYEEECDYFGHGIDPDETLVDDLYIRRPDGTWAHRVNAEWEDMQEPGEEEIVILLDKESAYHLADILDDKAPKDPSILPFELAMINPTEAALAFAAMSEIDWEYVDRVFDIYDSQERSVNAKKQVRGPGGKFGDMPDDPESKKQDTKHETKARLPQALPLVPDIAARIAQYIQENAGGAPAPTTPGAGPPTAAQINRLIELAEGDPAPATPDAGAGPRPLYLAIVDSVDTEAVLDVISLVPNGNDVVCWRRDKGTWVEAPEILADLRGVTPPPVVELTDDPILANVLEQVDKATSDTEEPETGPVSDSQNPDGSPVAPKPDANPDQHPIPAAGFVHPELDMFPNELSKKGEEYAKKGYSLPDGSFPIPDVAHLKKAIKAVGRAKNQSAAKKHIAKRAKALNRKDLIPDNWDKSSLQSETYSMWGPNGEIMNLVAAEGGADRNRGNAEKLRRYWTKGEGAAKIQWNTPGDWYRCVSHLSKYLGPRAKGYCTLRHKEATGTWPGDENNH
jgi:hypothetical protein